MLRYRKPSLNVPGELARVRANLPGKLPQCSIVKSFELINCLVFVMKIDVMATKKLSYFKKDWSH